MIIVGLQNAEDKYAKTRHNAGAIMLTHYVKSQGGEFTFDKYTNSYKFQNMYLPNTYMNLSGESVQKVMKKEEADSKDLYVFFDDATIPVGGYKISVGEGASSHNGIKSIIEALGGKNDFKRVRIGVGKVLDGGKLYEPGPNKFSDFVLSNMNNLEFSQIQSLAQDVLGHIG